MNLIDFIYFIDFIAWIYFTDFIDSIDFIDFIDCIDLIDFNVFVDFNNFIYLSVFIDFTYLIGSLIFDSINLIAICLDFKWNYMKRYSFEITQNTTSIWLWIRIYKFPWKLLLFIVSIVNFIHNFVFKN